MVFMMIINLLSGVNPSVVRADEENYYKNGEPVTDGGITISKNVTKYDSNSEEFEIELKVKGDSSVEHIQRSLDVVLVMDTSGSMNVTRMNNAKNAAKAFVNKLINNTSSKKTKIGIVKFATTGEEIIGLTDKKNELINKINELSSSGATYTQEGLKKAEEILNQSGADKKVMIVISDGEPTYAYGKYPDFKDWKEIYSFPNKINPDTEIWHGTDWNWIGKGYNSKFKNYIVKLKTGKIGNGDSTYTKHTLNYWLDHFGYFITLPVETAKSIRKSNIDIYSVGIGLNKNEKAKAVMKGISSNDKYAETGEDGELLNNVLANLAEDITSNKIEKGSISDSMGQYVNYQDSSLTITGTKDGKADDGLNEIIRKLVSKFNNNVLTIDGITLGKGEELSVKYKVKLKDNWKDGEFHPANGETTLTPTPNAEPMNFKVPEVRAEKETVTLTVNKKWIGEAPVDSVIFNIKAGSTMLNDTVVVKKDDSGNWTGKLENLPKYEYGKDIQYTVEEVKGNNYELKGDINSKADKDGNITFTATNQNTEKVNITVTKKWVNTPDEYKGDIKVAIYSRAEGETDFNKGDIQTLSKSDENKKMELFTNLQKYSKEGKLIEYKVEEEGTDKEGKLKIGDNSFKVDVEQSKNNNYDWTITNTCDPINEMIKFTLVKEWDTVPDESVKPMFTIKATAGKYSSSSSITLPIKEKEGYYNTEKSDGGKTWTTQIQALKYYKNNTPIKYTIEEEKLNGYESTFNVPKEFGDNDTVTFTNKRTMRTLTLEKKWIGDAESITGKSANFTIKGGGKEISFSLLAGKEPSTEDTKLPVYDSGGKPIEYTITEEKIEGYDAYSDSKQFTLVDGDNKPADKSVIFTNTKMLDPKKPFTVRKTWNGKTAESVRFGLFAYNENEPKETITLKSKDTLIPSNDQKVWTGTFKGELPEYKLVNGEVKKITYVVKEIDEDNQPVEKEVKLENRTYKVESRPAGNNVFNFTNTDITKGDVQIIKTWVGKEGQAKFGLFKNGVEKISNKEPVLTKTSVDGQYTVKFENVSLTDEEGKAVKYEIKELGDNDNILNTDDTVSLDDRKYKVSYDDSGNITNTELIDITVTKIWGYDVPQSEQQSVAVGVFKNEGSKTVKVQEIELKDSIWTGKFENLPYVDGGYQVKETKINGVEVNDDLKKLYKVEVKKGDNITATSGNVEITNDFNIEDSEGKIKVVKQWTVEPKDITVSLFTKEETPAGSVWKQVKKHVKTDGQSRIQTIEFDEVPTDVEYEILETAIGDEVLSEDAIHSILNDESDYPVKYKIGKYEVAVHGIRDNVFFIKNTNEDLLTEIKVTKQWTEVPANYKKPVKIQLYKEISESKLKAEGDPVELDGLYGWSWTFTNLDKKSGDQDIKYYVAEVGIGDQTKEINKLEQINSENGYMIGRYNVTITGNGTNNVVITNDVALIDVTAVKNWIGSTPRQDVQFTLYSKQGENLVSTDKIVTLNSTDENAVATFTELPRLDNEGRPVVYYVYETKIGATPITLNPTAVETMNYSVDVSGGKYSVEITDNGTNGDKKVIISNTFIPNPVGPVIPGGGTPVVPVNPPVDPTPNPTPNPSTPVVDVPDDSTPQGPSSPGNNSGEDGNTNGDEDDDDDGFEEIDEDEVPQDGNIDNTDDADDADDNNEEETTDIADNKAPKGTPKLPKTGGETGDFLSIIGLGLIGLGLVIRRRR